MKGVLLRRLLDPGARPAPRQAGHHSLLSSLHRLHRITKNQKYGTGKLLIKDLSTLLKTISWKKAQDLFFN